MSKAGSAADGAGKTLFIGRVAPPGPAGMTKSTGFSSMRRVADGDGFPPAGGMTAAGGAGLVGVGGAGEDSAPLRAARSFEISSASESDSAPAALAAGVGAGGGGAEG